MEDPKIIELNSQIEDLNKQLEDALRTIKLLRKKINRFKNREQALVAEIEEFDSFSTIDDEVEAVEDRCPECGALVTAHVIPGIGLMTVCTVCTHRHLSK